VQNQQQQIVQLEQSMRQGGSGINHTTTTQQHPNAPNANSWQTSSDFNHGDDDATSTDRKQHSQSDLYNDGDGSHSSNTLRLSHMQGPAGAGHSTNNKTFVSSLIKVDDENGAAAMIMRELRKDLLQRNAKCAELQAVMQKQASEISQLKLQISKGRIGNGAVGVSSHAQVNENENQPRHGNHHMTSARDGEVLCDSCERNQDVVRTLRAEMADLKSRLTIAEYGLRASQRSIA
jgi:hypothetical protein